ncbi:MAG TPA: alpha/beta hydrolase [Anaerolineales bacterium]|nr:alpha/beta hydrolase [Anaerolineales bacterium]
MKFAKPLLFGFFIVAAVAVAFIVWASSAMRPAPEAFAALRSDAQVTVSVDEYIVFQPASKKPTTGFVFYPGGRVDYRAYAAPLRRIAEQGYLVILLPVRLNLAFFDANAADRAIPPFPEIKHWGVGGHSLGGVAAALYASQHEEIDGLVLWASYPANDALKDAGIAVLSIYGTEDMNGVAVFEEKHALLPADTQYVVVQGGNHAQFGDYGAQPGDNEAAISRADQQKQTVEATVQFLKELNQ